MSINDSFFESQEVQLLKKELFGLNDVYRDIADEIGIENTLVIYKLFHGTQVSCDIIGGNSALLSNIASEQRAKVVYEYLYRQIDDKKVRETIDFLLNREEAHNQMFRDAFNEVQNSGSNQDFGTTKAAKMYFSLSDPGPNTFGGNNVTSPKFTN